ncbi:MAG TPA: hypothetical protein VFA05_10665 [Gaiellaceae bacterium]|nr:hypothetical protein [Gaiellaceae bacterium]
MTPQHVGLRVLRLVDTSRRAHFADGRSGPRVLVTYVRYPRGASRPLPLVVFCHGFASEPRVYARLLDAWARAGYVVAAPVFPVESKDAPGGPSEADLGNEPADISFVISQLTGGATPLSGLVDPTRIAVAGQSDGGEAAVAVAYDTRFLDRRIDAAVILSGAAFPGAKPFPAGTPPRLAVQGTADVVNRPFLTRAYFALARRPKFMLSLLGAPHLAPYAGPDRWSSVVERASIAFLDHYLRHAPLRGLLAAGTQPGVARLTADP